MEYIEGTTAKKYIIANWGEAEILKSLAVALGKCIATLHSSGVIHGDMTTSNFMLRAGDAPSDGVVCTVDFNSIFGVGNAKFFCQKTAVMFQTSEFFLLSKKSPLGFELADFSPLIQSRFRLILGYPTFPLWKKTRP
jgi:serine/threonine protein kinase